MMARGLKVFASVILTALTIFGTAIAYVSWTEMQLKDYGIWVFYGAGVLTTSLGFVAWEQTKGKVPNLEEKPEETANAPGRIQQDHPVSHVPSASAVAFRRLAGIDRDLFIQCKPTMLEIHFY